MPGIFRITDGTPANTIDLLAKPFDIMEWFPSVADLKDGGNWQSSPFADGRRMAFYRFTNIIDSLSLSIFGDDPDYLIEKAERDLRNLLDRARDYWASPLLISPIYIEARGECETETRYTVIRDYRFPTDPDPYHPPVVESGRSSADGLSLILEHGFWQAETPGTDSCLPIGPEGSDANQFAHIYTDSPAVQADVTRINPAGDAGFDNLPASYDLTWEFWLFFQAGVAGYVLSKTGATVGWWIFASMAGISATADYAVADAVATGNTAVAAGFHHIAVTLTLAGKALRIWIDGVESGYAANIVGVGAYVADAANWLGLGEQARTPTAGACYDDRIGHLRISKSIRYAAPFAPPASHLTGFGFDANTIITTDGGYQFLGKSAAAPAIASNAFTPGADSDTIEDESATYDVSGCTLEQVLAAPVASFGAGTGAATYNTYYYDASTATYIPVLNFPFSPPVVGAGDFIFLFSLTKLYTATIQFGGTSFQTTGVEYWTGAAWAVFNNVQNANWPVDNGVLHILRGDEYTTEATTNLVGLVGYYYRVSMTHVAGTIPEPPLSPSKVSPQIRGEDLTGDLPAILRLWGNVYQDSAYDVHRLLLCSRSVNRGAFAPNWYYFSGTMVADTYYETGIQTVNIAAATKTSNFTFFNPLTSTANLEGKYRGFFRIWLDAGETLGDGLVSLRLAAGGITRMTVLDSEPVPIGQGKFIDMGVVDLSFLRTAYYPASIQWEVDLENTQLAGAINFRFVDFLLLPVDETYIEIETISTDYQIFGFDIDPTTMPKFPRSVFSRLDEITAVPFNYTSQPLLTSVGIPDTPNGENQYLFALAFTLESGLWYLRGHNFLTIATRTLSLYHSQRGDS